MKRKKHPRIEFNNPVLSETDLELYSKLLYNQNKNIKTEITLSRFAQKQLSKLPPQIRKSLRVWCDVIEYEGLCAMRRIPGYHDEPLKGERSGQRSAKSKTAAIFENEMGPMTFGTFLTSVRTLHNFTQSELARRLKVRRSMICDIEKGRVLVSPALAAKIAKIGGFPVALAVRYCLQDQLHKAGIRLNVHLQAA